MYRIVSGSRSLGTTYKSSDNQRYTLKEAVKRCEEANRRGVEGFWFFVDEKLIDYFQD